MAEAARRSENEKLQAIMNALLLPVPGEPATGTKRFRDNAAAMPPAAPLAAQAAQSAARPILIEADAPALIIAQPRPASARVGASAYAEPVLTRRRGSLFVAPVELAGDMPEAATIAAALSRKGPLFAAAVEEVSGKAAMASDAAPLILQRNSVSGTPPNSAALFASVVSEIMAAVLELTVIEPMRDAMVTIEGSLGEESRKTLQRGRAGKLPKGGRTTKTVKASMAMAMRDARRLSFKIAAARDENATKDEIDTLRAELLQTRRRCHSPAYAKALREALPIVLPTIVPLGISPRLTRPEDPDAPPSASARDKKPAAAADLANMVAIIQAGAASAKPAPSAGVEAAARPAAASEPSRARAVWKRFFTAASVVIATSLIPAHQATIMTAQAEMIGDASIMTGSIGSR